VPHCGSVLPICLSLRPVGPIHIIIETVLIISCSPRADVGGPDCQSITPLIIWNIFIHILALSFNSIFYFLTEAAQYECSYRRTAHHATDRVSTPWLRQLSLWVFKMIFYTCCNKCKCWVSMVYWSTFADLLWSICFRSCHVVVGMCLFVNTHYRIQNILCSRRFVQIITNDMRIN